MKGVKGRDLGEIWGGMKTPEILCTKGFRRFDGRDL